MSFYSAIGKRDDGTPLLAKERGRGEVQRWSGTFVRFVCILLPWLTLGYGIRFAVFGVPTTLLELLLLAIFALFTMVHGVEGWKRAWRELPSRWLWLAWVLIGFCAALYSPVMLKGLGVWRAYLLEPVLVLLLVQQVIRTKEDRASLRASFFSAAIFVSLWAIGEFLTGWGIPAPWNVSILEGRRATGPYGYPNAVALFVVPIAAYAGARWLATRERLAGVCALLGVCSTFVVRSDGGLLALLVASTCVLLVYRKGRWFVATGAITGTTFLAVFPAIATLLWKELTFQGWSGRVRLWMWQETWMMLKTHWLFGAGLAGYPIVFDAFHTKRFIEIFQYPHNFVLTAWSEMGLIGLGVFLALLVTWTLRAWRSSSAMAGRMIGLAPLIAIVIHGLVDVPFWKNDLAIIFVLLWWMVAWEDDHA